MIRLRVCLFAIRKSRTVDLDGSPRVAMGVGPVALGNEELAFSLVIAEYDG